MPPVLVRPVAKHRHLREPALETMKKETLRTVESINTITVAVVAPEWLREPLSVLLNSSLLVRLLAFSTTVEGLLSAEIDQPGIVVLYSDHAGSQVERLRAVWLETRCVVLVEKHRQQRAAHEAGADEVLLQAVAPGRLLASIDALRGEIIQAHEVVELPAKG